MLQSPGTVRRRLHHRYPRTPSDLRKIAGVNRLACFFPSPRNRGRIRPLPSLAQRLRPRQRSLPPPRWFSWLLPTGAHHGPRSNPCLKMHWPLVASLIWLSHAQLGTAPRGLVAPLGCRRTLQEPTATQVRGSRVLARHVSRRFSSAALLLDPTSSESPSRSCPDCSRLGLRPGLTSHPTAPGHQHKGYWL
jgi:hypothetical protein